MSFDNKTKYYFTVLMLQKQYEQEILFSVCFFRFMYETESHHVIQGGLKLPMHPWLDSNSEQPSQIRGLWAYAPNRPFFTGIYNV